MFGRRTNPTFGKRAPAEAPANPVPPHPGPDSDGVARAIPKAVWDSPQGKFLRDLGMTPDDPSNLMPTPQLMQARADAAVAEQNRFLARINSELPAGATVIPWAMVPWTLWQGDHAGFLMVVCQLFPAEPWNQFLLAEDDKSAAVLGLPKHPRAYPPGLQDGAAESIGRFRREFEAVHARVGQRLNAGDTSALADNASAAETAKSKVIAMGNTFASITFGEEIYNRHLAMFGKALGWAHAEAMLAKPQG